MFGFAALTTNSDIRNSHNFKKGQKTKLASSGVGLVKGDQAPGAAQAIATASITMLSLAYALF